MTVVRQLFDVMVAGLLATVATFALFPVVGRSATTVGVVLACMVYFSRYPWGSQRGQRYNERIDQFYDDYLPI